MLIPNLQEIKYTNNGVVASPHLGSMQLQAKKAKDKATRLQATLHTPSSHGWSENQRTRLKRSSERWENKRKGLGTTPQQNSERNFKVEDSQTHLTSELQSLGSGILPLPTSYKCFKLLAHISTCKTSTRT